MTLPENSEGERRKRKGRLRLHPLLTFAVVVLAIAIGWVVPIYIRVVAASKLQMVRPADVIIVFGAAEYSGHPSPTFRARLDHALDLYRRGLAPILIVTGGSGADPKFSEGGVGRRYLVDQGVPDQAIIAEMQSSDTHQSAQRVANIMRANHMRTALAVSDGYHMFRVQQMMAHEGIYVFPAPRPQSKAVSFFQSVLINLRECLSYTLWKFHVT